MRILMSLALGLACTAGGFAADQGATPGLGGEQASATSQIPINTIDPVTGKPIDANLTAVLVPNASAASGNSSGMAGEAPAAGSVSSAAEPSWVAIGISEQSSAEQIRTNPQKFLQAARLNRKAQNDGMHSGSSSGLESGAQSGSTRNLDHGAAGQSSGLEPSTQMPSDTQSSGAAAGAGGGQSSSSYESSTQSPSNTQSSGAAAGQAAGAGGGQSSSSYESSTQSPSNTQSSGPAHLPAGEAAGSQSSGSSPGMEGRPGDKADSMNEPSGAAGGADLPASESTQPGASQAQQPMSEPAQSGAASGASNEAMPAETSTGSGNDMSEPLK